MEPGRDIANLRGCLVDADERDDGTFDIGVDPMGTQGHVDVIARFVAFALAAAPDLPDSVDEIIDAQVTAYLEGRKAEALDGPYPSTTGKRR
jgi:hypothetical protein